jgi:hypothetical protein
MQTQKSKFVRLWKKSPRFAVVFIYRRFTKKAKQLLPKEDWNINWLGEEMRPHNSLQN